VSRVRRLSRGDFFALTGVGVLTSTAIAARQRLLFFTNSVADFLYRYREPGARVLQASEHPMQYYLGLPHRHRRMSSQPEAVVIAIDGSDRDFWGYHAAFLRARRDLPFAVVTPFVVSNGGSPDLSDYPYSADVFNAASGDPLAFDVAGVLAIVGDARRRFGRELPVYLTGFSAGGHLAWLFVLTHADLLEGAAVASANFADRGLSRRHIAAAPASIPVRAFYGAQDQRAAALLLQWDRARAEAERRGCRDLTLVVVPGAGHSPFARAVIEYFTELAVRRRSSTSKR